MDILFLEPIFKHCIWGGTRLREEFGYKVEGEDVGECWGIAAHPNGDCIVKNGIYKGFSLSRLWKEHSEIFGFMGGGQFPLLTKIIDAKSDLSIQVHPDDIYAREHENGSFGKTECWYILDCAENSTLVVGHNASTKEELYNMVEQKKWKELIREVPVKKGDFIQIEPGTVHAIKGGILLLEIQQNSDITYRLYDYDRLNEGKPRELHIKQSLDVISVPAKPVKESIKNTSGMGKNVWEELISCKYYHVWKMNLDGSVKFSKEQSFLLVSIISGEGMVNGHTVKKGAHMILPADMHEVYLNGKMELVAASAD